MKGIRRLGLICLALIVGGVGLDFGESLSLPGVGGLIGSAEARVGHPLTPASVAGTARRTTRRVARRTSYRVNTLPPGCPYGQYYGGYYYYCGGRYYEKSGNIYIQVVFD